MKHNQLTMDLLEYEFLYNLRDQTILFLKMSDGNNACANVILAKLDSMVNILESKLNNSTND